MIKVRKLLRAKKAAGIAETPGSPLLRRQHVGAFITTRDFQEAAREVAREAGFPRIGLVNGRQLVDLLVERWDDIPQEFQERLGLILGWFGCDRVHQIGRRAGRPRLGFGGSQIDPRREATGRLDPGR